MSATGIERGQHVIRPWESTRIPGTEVEVWHDGKEPMRVTVLGDGAVDLPKGPNWIVRVVR